ncbi:hypothetical protein [Micromonospora carbonacea]|uniref:Uncharacterized protein n=1 Tax=Micromonospora carbonacea TaxID=47853 RepID=A0A1C5A9T6_9ACTN|nr:hypothetical protein [Micromonospora carbonacea]SCF41909.1 hypothetical protein GA0070563_11214 [Micromonospora carbonacea]
MASSTFDAATAATITALRAKLTPADPRDGITAIALLHRTRHVAHWTTKREAESALRTLRMRGLNVDKDIRVMPGCCTLPLRCRVITKLGEFGETLLMAKDGSWVAGQLLPERPDDHGAIWLPYESAEQGETIPPTFTHITTTVLCAGRTERYKTKSNGSCGRYVRSEDSMARCTCEWECFGSTRAEAQAAARVHRAEAA